MPLISVNMPAYNAGPFVAEAVESVLSQTLDDLQLVVVDDGSTDQTPSIVRRIAERDGRVRLISRPNTGVVGARNDALRISEGEFVAVLDADDVARPDRLERQVAYLRDHPECVAVGSRALIIDADGDPLDYWFPKRDHEEIDAVNLANDQGAALCHSSVTMRRSVVASLGGYREPYATTEDLDLWLRLAEVGQLATLDEPLVSYRHHLTNIGHTQEGRQWNAPALAVADARRRRALPPVERPEPPVPLTPEFEPHIWLDGSGVRARRDGPQVCPPEYPRYSVLKSLVDSPLLFTPRTLRSRVKIT